MSLDSILPSSLCPLSLATGFCCIVLPPLLSPFLLLSSLPFPSLHFPLPLLSSSSSVSSHLSLLSISSPLGTTVPSFTVSASGPQEADQPPRDIACQHLFYVRLISSPPPSWQHPCSFFRYRLCQLSSAIDGKGTPISISILADNIF